MGNNCHTTKGALYPLSPSLAPDPERAAVGSVDDAAAKLAAPNRNRIRFGPSSPPPVVPVLVARFDLPLTSRSRPISYSSSSARLRFSARNGTNPLLLPLPVPAVADVVVVAVAEIGEGSVNVVEMALPAAATADVEGLDDTRDSSSASSGSEDWSSSSPYSTSALIGGVRGRWIGVAGAGTRCVTPARPVRGRMPGVRCRLRFCPNWKRERGGERSVGSGEVCAGCGPGVTPSSSSSSSSP